MLYLNKNEVSLKVVPKPEASSYLYSYNVKYVQARVKYDERDLPHWVNFYLQSKKIWSCNVPYFLQNFERFVNQQ